MSLEQRISDWFKMTWGGGLVLPSGWFGRPYDNVHQLTSVSETSDGLVLVLDEGHLTLTFKGVPRINVTESELTFDAFKLLVFDWKEYGSMKPHSEQHEGGEVKIVAPPGV